MQSFSFKKDVLLNSLIFLTTDRNQYIKYILKKENFSFLWLEAVELHEEKKKNCSAEITAKTNWFYIPLC